MSFPAKLLSLVRVAVLLTGLGAFASASAAGLDLTLDTGHATSNGVRKYSVIIGWMQPNALWQSGNWRIQLHHEFEIASWHVPEARDLVAMGYSPVFRLERTMDGGGSALFGEASIGMRLLSHVRISPDRTMSTAFQFSDMIGAGWEWGRSTLGVRFHHLSNADIKKPNPGINFAEVYYRYRF